MKILLTGTTGQLGQALKKNLSQHHTVVAPTRSELDLSRTDQIAEYIQTVRPELIVNPAAYTAVDQAESEPDLAEKINAIAPGIMADEAKKLDIGLIHYSTDYVFDGSLRDAEGQLHAYSEQNACNPLNVYGKTKLAGEQAIQASACRHLILRTSWVYSMTGKNFLLTMLRLAKERKELRIVNDQWGAPTSAPWIAEVSTTLIQQIATAHDAAAWWKQHSGLYHLSTTGHTSWCGFTEEILRQAFAQGLLAAPLPVVHG
ncbi:MAG: dTDP-4-dehydrorhamnose reductase, partial [Burkholderiales bacterium]|nr:dTDP-4-dehydrorhamnose reductase [Burkholderiales bacterium]